MLRGAGRLRAVLWEYYPAALQAFPNLHAGMAEVRAEVAEVDAVLRGLGIRGWLDPPVRPPRRRSTRRREDVPELPRLPVGKRTIGQVDAGTYRPGTVVTFTLDSHGRVDAESVSIDVDSYGYRRAARDAIHFPVGVDPATKERRSKSEPFVTEGAALAWIEYIGNSRRAVSARPRPPEYGESVMTLALRGLESRTLDPYLAGWRRRVVPALGHLAARMVTNGAVDRAVHAWIADECSRSTVKNSLAVLVRGAGAGRSGWRPPLCATSLAGVVTQLVTQQRAL